MTTLKQIVFASVLAFALIATAAAQESTTDQRSSLTITANAVDDRVRITAPSSVVQMRVEIYAASGEKLFDQEIRGGNVFDWHLQDGQAQRLAPGDYVCVVTAKSISGKLTQKIGTVSVAEKSASVQAAESQQLSAAQSQTIGPVEENSSWTIPGNDGPQTPTVIANDGTDGQMIRGRGALTFRIGNFFSGIDKEQMRLTEDGRLGIGTSNPQAQLDVAGTIRAQRFLVAKPNTRTGDIKAQAPDDVDSAQPLASGSGTQDRIAKWTDNAGTLGDSSITDTGGNVGIGTTTPGSKLVVSANSSTLPPASGVARFADADGGQTAVFADAFNNNAIFNVRRANGTAAAPSAVQANQLLGVIGASGYGASVYMGTRARVAFWASEMWTNTANGTYLTFNTTANGAATPGGTERMRIDNAGNVGIGTSNPVSQLHVKGANPVRILGDTTTLSGTESVDFMATTSIFSSDLGGMRIQRQSSGDIDTIFLAAGAGFPASEVMRVKGNGDVSIKAGINNDGGGFKHIRRGPFNFNPGYTFIGAIWGSPFADANYTVIATAEDQDPNAASINPAFAPGCRVTHVLSKDAGEVLIKVVNDSSSTHSCTVHLIAIHD